MDAILFDPLKKHSYVTLSNGNKTMTNTTEGGGVSVIGDGDVDLGSGKYYIEFNLDLFQTGGNAMQTQSGFIGNGSTYVNAPPGFSTTGMSVGFYIDPTVGTYGAVRRYYQQSLSTIFEKASAPAWTDGAILQLAIDLWTGSIWVGVDNSWSGDPAAGTGAALTGFAPAYGTTGVSLICSSAYSSRWTIATDPGDHTYSPPTGFHAKFAEPYYGEISGDAETDETSELIREKYGEISGELGAWSEPHDLDDSFIWPDLGVSAPVDAFRDRSPIDGDVEFSASFSMFRGHYPFLTSDQNANLGFTPDAELQYNSESVWVASGFGISTECFNYTDWLRDNEDRISRVFEFTLTGEPDSTTDVVIPAFSIQARLRDGVPSYIAVQIPPSTEYMDQVTARPNGVMKVEMIGKLADGSEVIRELIAMADLEDIRTYSGGGSETITLIGYSTENYAPKIVTLENPSELREVDGKFRAKATVDFYLKPGDTAIVAGESFTVGLVTLLINPKRQEMEVTEA